MLDQRSQEILRHVIDAYVATGAPVGSKTLSQSLAQRLGIELSSATIRNVMASLEKIGLLFAPHTSAGRLPTELGLRFFVDGLLETGRLSTEEEQSIKAQCKVQNTPFTKVLEQATSQLSGLSNCAGLVLAPKTHSSIKHIEFVFLEPGKALVILVTSAGGVENRVVDIPVGVRPADLVEATNYLSHHMTGKTIQEALEDIQQALTQSKQELDTLSQKVIEQGLAVWSGDQQVGSLIVKGQANLLHQAEAFEDLSKIQNLFEALEAKESILSLLTATEGAEGIQIYIGTENQLFGLTGCSLVVSPLKKKNKNQTESIVGAIGVIGPTRMNYARIVPMVDYTAKVITTLMDTPK